MSSCNLRCRLIFLHGHSRTYRVASLGAGSVGRISYNLYFDCKHVRYVTWDLINEYIYVYEYTCLPRDFMKHYIDSNKNLHCIFISSHFLKNYTDFQFIKNKKSATNGLITECSF